MSKLNNNQNTIFQFIEWAAFRKKNYILRIDNSNKEYRVVYKEINDPYFDTIKDDWVNTFKIIKNKRISKKKFNSLKSFIEKNNIQQTKPTITKEGYIVSCTDGYGLILNLLSLGKYEAYYVNQACEKNPELSNTYLDLLKKVNIE
ncbi:hypothetical protein OBK04_03535 [Empedobacter falsenii]